VPVLEKLSGEETLARVEGALKGLVDRAEVSHGHVDVWCAPDKLPQVAVGFRDGDGLQFRFFTFLTAIDRSALGAGDEQAEGEQEQPVAGNVHEPPAGQLEVLVHLYAPDHAAHVNIHVPLADPRCPTITGVFRGALWHEREAAEMFGIDFDGHPRLVNLYLPEDFEGYPLLKSFKLPTRLVKDWPGAKDPEEAAAGGR
jgi:NADH:ubiquinone oxidoreductase subunit C